MRCTELKDVQFINDISAHDIYLDDCARLF